MDYITERITNISELEKIIDTSYTIAQIIEKEHPEIKNAQLLTDFLKKAKEFEFHIEIRKVSYCK